MYEFFFSNSNPWVKILTRKSQVEDSKQNNATNFCKTNLGC